MRIGNRWMTSNFEIQTPIGRGTIVGMSPDHKEILVMHTREKDDKTGKKGSTHAVWWLYDAEKGEIIDEVNRTKEE